jgi:hypothetical protein
MHAPQANRPAPRPSRSRRGAAIVEFAAVGPLLLFLILAMIEIGRMMMVQQVLTNAAREGARQAVLPGASRSACEDIVGTYLRSTSLQTFTVTMTDPATVAPGDPVTVSVSVPYEQASWLPVPLLRWMGGKVQSASAIMRKEGKTN